jgi:hypothetical protein
MEMMIMTPTPFCGEHKAAMDFSEDSGQWTCPHDSCMARIDDLQVYSLSQSLPPGQQITVFPERPGARQV